MNLELRLRGDKWYVVGSVLQHGSRVQIRQSTGYSKTYKNLAYDRMLEIQRDVLAGNFGTAKATNKAYIQTAIDLYEGRPEGLGKTDRLILKRFGKSFGHVRLGSVHAADIHLWTQARGNKASTVKRELNCILAMLSHGRAMGLEIPMIEIKKPKVDDERCRWLTEEERDRLIDTCPENIRGITTFLFYTGARISEAFSLDWHDVVDGKATFVTRKGASGKSRRRSVPLHDKALKAIGSRGKGLVFPNSSGSQWDRSNFYDYFNPACDEARIDDFTPHDCRHTFASHLVQKGASLRAVADLLGHSSLNMVMRYAHLAPTHLTTTMDLL